MAPETREPLPNVSPLTVQSVNLSTAGQASRKKRCKGDEPSFLLVVLLFLPESWFFVENGYVYLIIATIIGDTPILNQEPQVFFFPGGRVVSNNLLKQANRLGVFCDLLKGCW